jgi:hypothetical protein
VRLSGLVNWEVIATRAQRTDEVGHMCDAILKATDRDAALEEFVRVVIRNSGRDQRRVGITLLAEAFGIERKVLKRELRAKGLCGERD